MNLGIVKVLAQAENAQIRKGNKEFKKANFSNAQVKYTGALEKNPLSFGANYNLGNTAFVQKNYEEATKHFAEISQLNENASNLALANFNLGNSYMAQQKYQEAVQAYKTALKHNPDDYEAKYNLSYAQKKLKESQQNQQNQNKENQQDENKNENQQNKENNEEQNQEKQENQNQQNNENQNQNQPQKQKISPQDAQRLLKAIDEADKKVQQKLAKEKAKASKTKLEKDW
jgi:tetratricopeptide (TPR) repeat protein